MDQLLLSSLFFLPSRGQAISSGTEIKITATVGGGAEPAGVGAAAFKTDFIPFLAG
jgi:hypothetical protein